MHHRTSLKAKSPYSSQQLAQILLGTLIETGVKNFVVSPGSRNAPLSYALADAEKKGLVRVHIRIDERDAGFTALGLSKVDGSVSAVITTSGTAVANIFPAVLEAKHSGIPIVFITADRPESLHGTGANQTTGQFGIFGDKVLDSVVLPSDINDASSMIKRIKNSCKLSTTAPRGPAHVNIQFEEPLIPPASATSDQIIIGLKESGE